MATVAPPVPSSSTTRGVQPLRAGQGNSFLWRKLHSLSGIVPIGAFLVEHILSNFEAIHGPLAYAQQVKFLNSLPLVRVLEWAFIFIPLAFHAGYGVFIAFRGRSNVNVYPWAGNWMYIAQRVTGLIAFVYIIQHVWRQRFSGVSLPEHPGAAFAKVQHELANPWMLAIYVIAMVATTWHFAYGIWLFAAKWGITPGDRARKRFGYVCAAIGTALCVMGLWGMWAFVGPQYQNAPADVMPTQTSHLLSGTIPMFDPNGVVRLVPYQEIDQAIAAGGTRAVKVEDSDNSMRWLREDQVEAAVKQGANVVPYSPHTK